MTWLLYWPLIITFKFINLKKKKLCASLQLGMCLHFMQVLVLKCTQLFYLHWYRKMIVFIVEIESASKLQPRTVNCHLVIHISHARVPNSPQKASEKYSSSRASKIMYFFGFFVECFSFFKQVDFLVVKLNFVKGNHQPGCWQIATFCWTKHQQ